MSAATTGRSGRGASVAVKAAVAIMCLVWGSTWLVLKVGLEEMEPLGSAALRFMLAGVLMAPIAPWIARREGGAAPTWDLVFAMAIGNFALSYGIVYWAEEVVPSAHAAILWGVFPLVTALVGHVYLPTARIVGIQWLGLFLGFLGVVALLAKDLDTLGGDAVTRGTVLLGSPMVSALATAYVKKHGQDVSAALLNRSALVVGGALLWAAAWAFEGGITLPTTPRSWFTVVYLGGFGTVLTFTLYFWVLRQASAVSLSLIAYVTPAIALVLGVFVGDEQVTVWTGVGLAFILLGCGVVLQRSKSVK